ncbi:hypothetical protein V6N11_028271 [Hibiscus sabdariffa]|uniref:Uncharacterized protein n=1 Tax=Hibiscus sabdariffa TaxID=183260 RepID=A0ABR2NQ13_9ROSI
MQLARYSTGLGVTGRSAFIHDFYSREVPNPVHFTVDTGFRNGEVGCNRIGCPRRKLDTDRRFQDTNKRVPLRAEFYIKFIGVYSHQCTIAAGGVEHAVAGSSIYVHDHSGTETRCNFSIPHPMNKIRVKAYDRIFREPSVCSTRRSKRHGASRFLHRLLELSNTLCRALSMLLLALASVSLVAIMMWKISEQS